MGDFATSGLRPRFGGPFCAACEDSGVDSEARGCLCPEARCSAPSCGVTIYSTAARTAPVPASLLLWRTRARDLERGARVSTGWACSVHCLYLIVQARHAGDLRQRAEGAARDLVLMKGPYMGLDKTKRGDGELDPRVWDLIAKDQLRTINAAIRFAHQLVAS